METNIRLAQPGDAQRIWEIRNEPAALAVAASQDTIPLIQHVAWFNDRYFSGTGNVCFVAEFDKQVVGYSRFDLKEGHFVNSIAITSSMHGRGIGTLLLIQSVERLKTSVPIHAEIRRFNTASIRMFEKVGFKKISEDETNLYYQL